MESFGLGIIGLSFCPLWGCWRYLIPLLSFVVIGLGFFRKCYEEKICTYVVSFIRPTHESGNVP